MQTVLLIIASVAGVAAMLTGFFTPLAIAIQAGLWALSLDAVDKDSKY
jgi:hypothetical protein